MLAGTRHQSKFECTNATVQLLLIPNIPLEYTSVFLAPFFDIYTRYIIVQAMALLIWVCTFSFALEGRVSIGGGMELWL